MTEFDSMKLSDLLESQETDIANTSDLSEDEAEPINDVESGKLLSDSVEDEQVTGFGSMKLSDPLESQEPDIMNTSDLSINEYQEGEPVSHDDEEEPIVADEEGNATQMSDSQDQGEPIVLDKEVDTMRIEGSQPMVGVESSPAKSDSFDCEACSNKRPNNWVMRAKRGLLGWKTCPQSQIPLTAKHAQINDEMFVSCRQKGSHYSEKFIQNSTVRKTTRWGRRIRERIRKRSLLLPTRKPWIRSNPAGVLAMLWRKITPTQASLHG